MQNFSINSMQVSTCYVNIVQVKESLKNPVVESVIYMEKSMSETGAYETKTAQLTSNMAQDVSMLGGGGNKMS